MPPSGFKKRAILGALQFVKSCYEGLLAEVRSGKYRTYEEAIEHELGQINTALEKAHIDAEGNLVER